MKMLILKKAALKGLILGLFQVLLFVVLRTVLYGGTFLGHLCSACGILASACLLVTSVAILYQKETLKAGE